MIKNQSLSDIASSNNDPRKRILRVHDFLNGTDQERTIYPKGILGSLEESSNSQRIERIELFARKKEKKYGIIKKFFVAFSSESKLIQLASASSNVIEVHALKHENKLRSIVEDKLILKRTEENKENRDALMLYRRSTPRLLVSQHWLDLMNLKKGDSVIVSNPRENYEVPPPSLREV